MKLLAFSTMALLTALFLAGYCLAEEGSGSTPPGNGEAKPADPEKKPAEGEAKPAEGEAKPAEPKPAEGEAKPAEGEAKPAEAGAKPAEGEAKPAEAGAKPAEGEAKPAEAGAKPAEGEAKPAEAGAKPAEAGAKPGETAKKPDEAGAKAGKDDKVPSPFKTARGFDLLKFSISEKGQSEFTFTDSSKFTSKGVCKLEINRRKADGKYMWNIDLQKGSVTGTSTTGYIVWKVADMLVYGLDTKTSFCCLEDGKGKIANLGEGKLGARGFGMLAELRQGQCIEICKGVTPTPDCKGEVGIIKGGKVELLKPGSTIKADDALTGKEPEHALCKKLCSPDFLKDLFSVDTGDSGSVELLLKDGGRIYTPEEASTKFNVSFIEKSPRDTILTLLAGEFSFDLGPDLVTVEIPKVLSVSARNAVYKVSSAGGLHRIDSLGGERLVATTAKELLESVKIVIQADARSSVESRTDPATGEVVFTVTPESQRPVSFTVSAPGKGGGTIEKKLIAPAGSSLRFAGKGLMVTVKIPKPEGEFSATIPLGAGVIAPWDAALQDHGDLIDIKNVSPGNP